MREGWKMQTFGEIATFASGSRPKGGVGGLKDGVLSLGGEHIGKNGWLDLTSPKYVEHSYYAANPKGHIKDNDILLCKDGALSGKVAIVRDELNETQAMVNEHVFLIRSSVISPRCLYYYLFSQSGQTALKAKITGAAQGGINGANLKTIIVPVPPTKEQEKIVAELDCLSAIIEKKKQQLKELDNLAQSIFYDMFGDEKARNNNWKQCQVGDIYKFQYGKGNKIPEDNGDYPCYGSNGMVGHHITYNSEDAPIIGHIGAYAGIVNWGQGKHFVTYNGVICKLKDVKNNPIYGYYMLKAQDYLNAAKRGGAQPFVSYDLLEEPKVFLPPIDFQNDFAQKIEAIEKQKELIKKSIQETETLFNSRMDYWFN